MPQDARRLYSRPVFDQTVTIHSNHAQRLLDRGFLLVVRALYGIDVVLRIIGDDGTDLPDGEIGERVRFWGYDRTIEVSFFVEAEALKRLCPDMDAAEAGFLKAFDKTRGRILEVADRIYTRGGGGKGAYTYVLSAADF